MKKNKLYKNKYLIALYDFADEWPIDVFRNAEEFSNAYGQKKYSRFYQSIEQGLSRNRKTVILDNHKYKIHLIEAGEDYIDDEEEIHLRGID